MRWGGFGQGLASGINAGVRLGMAYRQAVKEDAAQADQDEVRRVAAEEARRAEQIYAGGTAETGSATQASAPQAETPASDTRAPLTDQNPVEVLSVPAPEKVEVRELPPIPHSARVEPAETPTTPQSITMPQNVSVQPQPQAQPQETGSVAVPSQPTPQANPQQPAQAQPQTLAMPQQPGAAQQQPQTPQAAAERTQKMAGSVEDLITNRVAVRLQRLFTERGDLDKAEKYQKQIETRQFKNATRLHANAMAQLQTGDVNEGVRLFGQYYNQYIGDGETEFKGGSLGEDGMLNITMRRKGSDKDETMKLSTGQLLQLGMAHDPASYTAALIERQKASEAGAADAAKEGRKFQRDVALKGVDQQNKLEQMTVSDQLESARVPQRVRDEFQARTSILREQGIPEEQIQMLTSSLLNLDTYRKGASPEEERRMLLQQLAKSDMFTMATPERQQQMIDNLMNAREYMTKSLGGVRGGAPAEGAPPQGTSQQPARGLPLYDPRTGKRSNL